MVKYSAAGSFLPANSNSSLVYPVILQCDHPDFTIVYNSMDTVITNLIRNYLPWKDF